MLMLTFFPIFAISYAFPSNILNLRDDNFRELVDNRPNKSVIFVMFHGERCPACQASYPEFVKASRQTNGLITFGHVDCSRNRYIPHRFHVASIPTFYIFHPNGFSSYSSFSRSASKFISAAVSKMPNYVEKANKSWIDDRSLNAIVLIKSGFWTSMPDEWRALAFNFSDHPIKFGYADDRATRIAFAQQLATSQGESPNQADKKSVVYFIINGQLSEYKERFTFMKIQSEVYKQFNLPVPKKPEIQEKISSKLEFLVMCRNKPRYCVIEANAKAEHLTNETRKIAQKYAKDQLRFLVCGKQCPSQEMEPGKIYIFHPKKNSMIVVSGPSELSQKIEHVLAGNAEWEPSLFGTDDGKSNENKEL
ncbi:hypothetical protein TRFO_31582 [Tritrichomonas foetus]|uniref:Thioredoxin domain-containing protein n=1 Tax=Tritrichomonas foetus TaxID=1144522 RepID=A0A1J4JVJ3_9EUKA|nr:hypothetical protein TRFO_31582 [Tritrichomonas foetus]|eukprot:OHT01548.1 hypothetical protein TRFO_31582 [Tritrichomonas foetus]